MNTKKLNRVHIAILIVMALSILGLSGLYKLNKKLDLVLTSVYNNGEPALYEYATDFVNTAERYGYDISYIYNYPVIIQFETTHDGTAAYAYGMDDDELVLVGVNPNEWYTLGLIERKQLIFHELFHDVFNIEHDETEEGIMRSGAGYLYSIDEVEKDLGRIFEKLEETY